MITKAFFIGGPGTISTSTIQDIADRGDSIGLFTHPTSLSKPLDSRIKTYPGERNDTPALAAVLDEFKSDIVLDFVCFTPQQGRNPCAAHQGKGNAVHSQISRPKNSSLKAVDSGIAFSLLRIGV